MKVNIRLPRTGGGEGREQISDGAPLLLPPPATGWDILYNFQDGDFIKLNAQTTLPQLSTHFMRNIYILDSSILYDSCMVLSHNY